MTESDPRVVSVDGEQVIISASWNTGVEKYHTTDCQEKTRLSKTKQVSKDIAEWKGLSECKYCLKNK